MLLKQPYLTGAECLVPSPVTACMSEAGIAILGISRTASRWRKAELTGKGWDWN